MFESSQNIPGTHGNRAPYEGQATTEIEKVTSKAPSLTFLIGAGVAFAGAAALVGVKKERWGFLLGQVPPMLLLMGLYNKIVKLASAEQERGRAI
ncbi:hypothetical protein L6R52_33910 [Myxococcota bacterium]|nr:hypothetical protein [Myxococcota bacterium]